MEIDDRGLRGCYKSVPSHSSFFSELRKRVVNANMSPIRHYMQSTASFSALVVLLLLLLLSQTGGSSAAFLCEFPSRALLKQVQTIFLLLIDRARKERVAS